MSEYFPVYADESKVDQHRETAEFVAWIAALDTWRAGGCQAEQPQPPDLTRAVEVWRGGVVVSHQPARLWLYDMRGVDLSAQPETVGYLLDSPSRDRMWRRLGCTLPGHDEAFIDERELRVAMAFGVMLTLGISRSKAEVREAICAELHDASKRVAAMLQHIELETRRG